VSYTSCRPSAGLIFSGVGSAAVDHGRSGWKTASLRQRDVAELSLAVQGPESPNSSNAFTRECRRRVPVAVLGGSLSCLMPVVCFSY
jgi:hypothetical protein